jgi:hypothetical protein
MDQEKDKKIKNVLTLVIVILVGFCLVISAFGVGIWVGEKRAEFSFRWAEDYHRNFGGPQRGIFGNFPAQDFINSHGIFGQVITIDGNNIMIKGQDNMEKTAVVSEKTTMVTNATKIPLSSIKVNDMVVIIGSPNAQGQIDAKFIRVLPQPSSFLNIIDHYEI